MCMDVNDFYLNNQMDRDKYTTIQLSMIPQNFVEDIISIYARVTKGMYGIPQAVWIAHDSLLKHIATFG